MLSDDPLDDLAETCSKYKILILQAERVQEVTEIHRKSLGKVDATGPSRLKLNYHGPNSCRRCEEQLQIESTFKESIIEML